MAESPNHNYLAKMSPSHPGLGDRGPELIMVLAVVLAVAWISVLLRAYVRILLIRNVAADDWLMFVSMVGYTCYSTIAMWGVIAGGTGKYVAELTLEETLIGLKAWYLCEMLSPLVTALVRTSVAVFLLRIAHRPMHKWIIWSNLGVVYFVSTVFLFLVAFQCSPPSYFYEQVVGKAGSCFNINVVPNATIAISVIGAACDLIFALLPIALLWNVQLNKRTKAVVAVLLGMGFVAGLALLVRIPFVKRLAIAPEFLFQTVDVAIWSVLESSLGIIASCVATLRPLFKSLGIGRMPTTSRQSDEDFGLSRPESGASEPKA